MTPRVQTASATSGRTWSARSSTSCCRSRSSSRSCSIWQGSIQNFSHYLSFTGITHLAQTIAMGPVASQEAIKLLGTNGGGFFNTNSAHPFENPTAFTNFVEMLVVLVIPAALGLHLRPHGRQPPAGLRDLRNDDGDVPRRRDRVLHRRGARLARAARGRPAHGRDLAAPPAATSRARSNASASPARRCSTWSRPSPRVAP